MNFIQQVDKNGNLSTPKWVEQSLSNINRFFDVLDEAKGLFHDGSIDSYDEVNRLETLSEDFFNTWQASSTMLINAIGKDNCYQLLEIFRKHFYITFQSEEVVEFFMDENLSIEIFRGESPNLVAKGISGISWTTNRSIAQYYANRHSDGVVLQRTVLSKDVLAVFGMENEIIIRESSSLS